LSSDRNDQCLLPVATIPTEVVRGRDLRSRARERHPTDGGQEHAARETRPESGGGAASLVGSAQARQRLHAQRLPFLDEAAILESACVLGDLQQRGREVTARDRRSCLP